MKQSIFILFLVLGVSCTSAPTMTPTSEPPPATLTSTPQIQTSTLTTSPSPTITREPPTPTAAPIKIESLNLTQPVKTWQGIPRINPDGSLSDNNDNRSLDDPRWSWWLNTSDRADHKVVVSVSAEPNSPVGPAYRYTINEYVGELNNFRAYATKFVAKYPYPVDWSMESTLMFDNGTLSGYLSLLNEFDLIGEKVDQYNFHVMSGVDVKNGVVTMAVRLPVINNPKTDIRVTATNPDGTVFRVVEGIGYSFKKFTNGNKYYLAINGNIVAQTDIPEAYRGINPKGWKSGAYGFNVPAGSSFLETPIKIEIRKR